MSGQRIPGVPGDIILEPNEHVLEANRPLFLWEPLVLLWLVLGGFAVYGPAAGDTLIATVAGLADTITFTATGEVDAAAFAMLEDGDGQSTTVGTAVPVAPAVEPAAVR